MGWLLQVYYHEKDKCKKDPLYRTSVIDDGMGNQCTHMPFLGTRVATEVAKLDKMKWKVQTGEIAVTHKLLMLLVLLLLLLLLLLC